MSKLFSAITADRGATTDSNTDGGSVGVPFRTFDDFHAAFDVAMSVCDKVIADSGVVLKKVSHSAALSEETEAFSAEVWMGGKKIATADNSGRGGETMVWACREGRSVNPEGLATLRSKLFDAIEAEPRAFQAKVHGLIDRLLFTQHIRPKQMRSDVGRTKICWFGEKGPHGAVQVHSVKWPALHKLWKTDPKRARDLFVKEGVSKGWFAADAVPAFHNDVLWGRK